MADSEVLAKLRWIDPESHGICEYMLTEGTTATIGRSSSNDIQIAEQHVSRQHAVVSYRDGIFMINDLGSSNGTFVNDNRVNEPYPLFAGDEIRLYVPRIRFLAADGSEIVELEAATVPVRASTHAALIVTNGAQEGQSIPLLANQITIGRATISAGWEVLLQDPSVSRPHARLERRGMDWYVFDLGSSNGTRINQSIDVNEDGYKLRDGDTIELGGSMLLFRSNWSDPMDDSAARETKGNRD
jgi:pSer/pThr/pTyr-binding forkhead associated (FHA) protein